MRRFTTPELALLLSLWPACTQLAGLEDKTFGDGSGGSSGAPQHTTGGGPAGADAAGSGGHGGAGEAGSRSGGLVAGGGAGAGGAGAQGVTVTPDGGSTAETCVDLTEALCLQTYWPEGTIPYSGLEALPKFIASSVLLAMSEWEGLLVGSTALHFSTDADGDVPRLVFELVRGCAPRAVSDRSVTLAIGSCATDLDISRAIGVALGLPRMHQRTDRNRHLQMGAAASFECERGEFYSRCPARGDIPAQFGPFEFRTLMFAPGVEFDACVGKPEFEYLYVPRGESSISDFQCDSARGGWGMGWHEASALAELYAIPAGFRPFAPVGVEEGSPLRPENSTLPLNMAIAPNAYIRIAPSVVALGEERLAAFALTAPSPSLDPEITTEIWELEYDGTSWGEAGCCWERWLPGPPAFSSDRLAVSAARAATGAFDFFALNTGRIIHASHDRERRVSSDWRALSAPFSGSEVLAFAVAERVPGISSVIAHVGAESGANAGIYVLDWDGVAEHAWQPLPPLPPLSSSASGGEALAAVVTPAGEQHVVITKGWGRELWLSSRHASGGWSEWTPLNPGTEASRIDSYLALVSNPSYELGVLWQDPRKYVWFYGCKQRPCNVASSWDSPMVLANGTFGFSAVGSTSEQMDILALYRELHPTKGTFEGIWHKGWRPPGGEAIAP